MNKKHNFIYASIVSSICFFASIIYLLCFPDNIIRQQIVLFKSNAITYAFCIFVLVFSFVISFLFIRKTKIKSVLNKSISKKAFIMVEIVLAVIVFLLLFNRMFFQEAKELGFSKTGIHYFSTYIGIIFFLFSIFISIFLYIKKVNIPKYIVYLFYFVTVVLVFVNSLVLDMYNADIYHGTAYTESIYNVYNGVPFTFDTSSMYGHYAILYGIILKVFNGNSIFLFVLISLISSLSASICCIIIHKTSDDNLTRILSTIFCNIPLLGIRFTNYWQLYPHRIIFPLLLILYLVTSIKKRKYICFAIITLAILWNTETGVTCGVSYILYLFIEDIYQKGINNVKTWKKLLLNIALFVLSIILTFVCIFIYNAINNYYIFDLHTYLFPLLDNTYVVDELKYNMVFGNYTWIYVLVINVSSLFINLYYLYKSKSNFNDKSKLTYEMSSKISLVFVLVSFISIINFSYYANRASYGNIGIVIYTTGLNMCFLIDHFINRSKTFNCTRTIESLINSVCIVLLLIAVSSTDSIAMSSVKNIKYKYLNQHYDYKSINNKAEQLKNNVPKDTYAFGYGISSIYQQLHWDTKCYHRDFTDITCGNGVENQIIDTIVDEVLNEDNFVVVTADNDRNIDEPSRYILKQVLSKDSNYQLKWSFDAGSHMILYYKK